MRLRGRTRTQLAIGLALAALFVGCRFDSDYHVAERAYGASTPADRSPPRIPSPANFTPPASNRNDAPHSSREGPRDAGDDKVVRLSLEQTEESRSQPIGSARLTIKSAEPDFGSGIRGGILRGMAWQAPTREFAPPPQTPPHDVPLPGDSARRFEIPHDLPGSDAPPLSVPPFDRNQPIEERRSLVESLFPDLPAIPGGATPVIPADARDYALSDFQELALANSPVLQQAAADVEIARGHAVQAGLYPNPTVGFEQDTVFTARTAGYSGAFMTQTFVTADKLTKAQNVALMDMRSAEATLRRTRIELASNVRSGYFHLLVAQEQLKFSRAMSQLAENVYQAQIDLVAGDQSPAYEVLQLRVLAMQARNAVVRAENSYVAAWRELAATLGLPQLQLGTVSGSILADVPVVDYHAAVAFLLARHTDLVSAQAQIARAVYNLDLQQVTPIPNVGVYGAAQYDATTPLSHFSYNLQVGVPLPLFDRNQGNITAAHASNIRARQTLVDVRNTLLAQLAEVFNRYESSRTIAANYRSDILQDQVRVYRSVYERFRQDNTGIDFSQIVITQQSLAQVVSSYLQAVNDQWQATVNLARLLQVDDLFSMDSINAGVANPLEPAPAAEAPE